MPPCAASCIRIARPSWRAPTTITAISHVSGLGHSVTSAIAAAMVPQAWTTSHIPRSELREVSRLHSSGVKTVLGSTRATTGIDGSLVQFSGFILRDGAEEAPPQDEVLTLMVRSAAAPRVSNHVAAEFQSYPDD